MSERRQERGAAVRRVFWERHGDEYEAWNELGMLVGVVRRSGRQWEWVVFDGFRDSRGICLTLAEAKARVRELGLHPRTAC